MSRGGEDLAGTRRGRCWLSPSSGFGRSSVARSVPAAMRRLRRAAAPAGTSSRWTALTARPGGPSYAQARRDQFRVLTVRDGDRAIAARSLHPVRGWAHGMVWACRSHRAVAPSCRAGGWLRAAARRWVCRDASAGIKGLAVGACQTRRMPPTTPLWTLPTPPRERPRCCVTRAAFSAASTSSPPAWQTPQLPPSDPSAKHATLSRGSSQNWCMRSTPSVAPPSKRCAGVASTSPRDGVVRAARNRSREHHGGLHRQVNTPPNGRTAKIRPKGASGPAERP